MSRYGYARVSSTDQDRALQEARLREAGCKVIRAERVSEKAQRDDQRRRSKIRQNASIRSGSTRLRQISI